MTHLSPMLGACLVVFVFLMLLEFFVLQPNSSSWLATKMWTNPCIIYITAPGWEKENVYLKCLLCLVFLQSPRVLSVHITFGDAWGSGCAPSPPQPEVCQTQLCFSPS